MKQWISFMSLMASATVGAQPINRTPPSDLQVAQWAVSCMACHGTDGKAEGVAMTLAGRKADELYGILLAYKTGQRHGTIMQQHAKGYADEELRYIAQYFAHTGQQGARP